MSDPANTPIPLAGSPTTSAKIMIVDDEPVVVQVVRKHLRDVGYQHFVPVTDSTKVYDLVAKESPDLVLLDVLMPEMDGLEVLHACRSDPRARFMAVIMLTAANDLETKLRAFGLGANDFVGKPLELGELLPCVRNALMCKAHRERLESCVTRSDDEAVWRDQLLRHYGVSEPLLTSLNTVLIEVGEDRRVTRWNVAAERHFGVTADEAIGRELGKCSIDWDRESADVLMQAAWESGAPEVRGEIGFLGPAGREGVLDVLAAPARTEPGAPASGLSLVIKDISELTLREWEWGRRARRDGQSMGR